MRRAPLLGWTILVLGACLAAGPARAAGPDAALRARAAREGRVPVIVELDLAAVPEGWLAPDAARAQRRRVVDRQIDAIHALGGTDAGPALPYPVIPFLALEAGPRALDALARSPAVRGVRAARAHAPQLGESVPAVQGDAAHALGFDGAGQAVVVLDTGVDGGHQDFPPGKIVDEACFAAGADDTGLPQAGGGDCPGGGDTAFGPGAGAPCTYAGDCFHGTHVAGIAAGAGPERPGVAPGAGLVSIQVFSEFPAALCPDGVPCPRSWEFDQDAALLHVYEAVRLSHDVAAVNLSLGSGAFTGPCDDVAASTKAAVDVLRSVGIATVAASGNFGCTSASGSPKGCTDAIAAPACISSVVSVGAVNEAEGVPGWSNTAPFLSLYAPGASITAPRYLTTAGYKTSSGTSMAAPHAAGAWAVARQAVPGASVGGLLGAFQATGTPLAHAPILRIRDALAVQGHPACGDGLDNDGDGLTDGADPGCDDASDPFEVAPSLPCDDGIDNDGDGAVDLADPGCRHPQWLAENPQCDDGLDNDGDGGIDLAGSPPDPDCREAWQHRETPASGSCGLGGELLAILPLLRRRRLRRPPQGGV